VSLAGHPGVDVRCQVAQALPAVATGDFGGIEAGVLVRRTGDPDADVRDCATFGLGSRLAVDTSAVRAAACFATRRCYPTCRPTTRPAPRSSPPCASATRRPGPSATTSRAALLDAVHRAVSAADFALLPPVSNRASPWR
jgi:hypothetical protein